MSENRGLYRYNKDGDVNGLSLAFMDKCMVSNPLFDDCMKGCNLLDIGCGNGRMWKLLHGRFTHIVGLDPYVDTHPNFVYPNCRHKKVTFAGFKTDETFDTILFNQSFYLMLDKMVRFKKSFGMLKTEGTIVLIDDASRDDAICHNSTPELFYSIERLCWRFKLHRAVEVIASKTRFTALRSV